MEQFVTRAIEAFIFPPGIFLIVFALAAVLLQKKTVIGQAFALRGDSCFLPDQHAAGC